MSRCDSPSAVTCVSSLSSLCLPFQELEFANLTAVLHCIHSFIAAKVASMDPLFMCGQSFHGTYMNST